MYRINLKLAISFFILLMLVLGHRFLLRQFAAYLVLEPTPLKRANVIVVLGGDPSGIRIKEGVRLLKEGYASHLLFTHGGLYHTSYSKIMAEYAVSLGVDPSKLLYDNQSYSTYDHGRFVPPILLENKQMSCIIVTSKFHTRRVASILKPMFDSYGIRTQITGSDDSIDYQLWWKDSESIETVLIEWFKTIWYVIYY